MHASAVFGAPPPGDPPGGAPPRAPHGQPTRGQQYGHPNGNPNGAPQQPQLQPPQYGGGYGQPPPVPRSHSRDYSQGGFETLDLHSNRAGVGTGANASGAGSARSAPGNAGAGAAGVYNASAPGAGHAYASSQGEDFSNYNASSQGEDFSNYNASSRGEDFGGYNAAATASGGPENFGGHAASSRGEDFSNYNASAQGENFSSYNPNEISYNASSQGGTFAPPPPQPPPPEGRGGEETFEYEGVALQTALTAFGTAASLAGNMAGGVMSSVAPGRLAGNMASFRGRIADVVAPVGGGTGPTANAPPTDRPPAPAGGPAMPPTPLAPSPRPPSPYMRGTSGGSAGSAAEVFAAPSPQASPVVTSVQPPQGAQRPPQQPLPPAAGGSWQRVHDDGGGATEFFGAAAGQSPPGPPPVQSQPAVPPQGPPQQQPSTAEQMFLQPPQPEPRRQQSHRLSSLENATHDPHSFQYADPLEGTAEVATVAAATPATAMEMMQRGSEPVAQPSAPAMPPTPAAATASLPAPRRRPPLPAPKKPNLPLPPPMSARKKIPKPSEGSLASSTSSAGKGNGGAHFRKPPPLEVRASPAGTPRFPAPSAPAGAGRAGASPRASPRFRAPPSPREAGPAWGVVAWTSPRPSPRTAGASPGTVPPLPLPLPSPGAGTSTPRAPARPPPGAGSPAASSRGTAGAEATPSPKPTTEDRPGMALAVVRGAVEGALRRVASEGAPVASPPSAASVPQGSPPPIASAAASAAAGAFHAAQLPLEGLHPATVLPAVLPDAASSRVTECDAVSDYQGLVREEDVPPGAPATPGMDSGAKSTRDERGISAAGPHGAVPTGSSAVVAADGRSDRPEPPKDEDAPPAAEREGAAEEPAPVEGGAVLDDPAAEWPAGEVAEETAVLSQEREEGGGVAADESTHEDPAPDEAPHDGPPVDALPDGWTAAADPASGNAYYYHPATGEARWDRPTAAPIGGDAAREAPASEVAEGAAAEDAPAPAVATEPVAEVPAGEGPAAAEPAEEGARATTPTARAEGADTSRDPAAADGAPPAGPTAPAVRPLAEGWRESTDPSTGNPYYYHGGTGETTWDRPASNDAAETEATAGGATVAAAAPEFPRPAADTSAERSDDERAAREPAPQPPSAVAAGADPAVDAVEETHDEPREGAAPATEPSVPAAPAAPLEEPAVRNALPEGWREARDPSTGNVYYFQEATGETRWDRPAVATAPAPDVGEPPAEGAPSAEGAVEETTETSLNEAAPSPSAQPLVVEPGPEADVAEPKERPAAVDAPSSEAAPPGVRGAGPLAEGWVEATDESSGSVYYYKEATGETRWERPMAAPAAAKETALETPPPPVEDEGPEKAPAATAGDGPMEPLDEGWTAVDRPAREAGAAPPEGLPEGWAEAADPTTGRAYYYREGSDECAWERPVAAADGPVGEAPRGDRDEAAAEDDAIAGGEESAQASGGTEPTGAPSLPEGWSEATDPTSGKIYYYQEATGETTWDRPRPPPAAAPAPASLPTTTAATEPRPRPAHALAAFGFGGRLCVMIPRAAAALSGAPSHQPGGRPALRRGPVVIHRLRSVIPQDGDHAVPSPASAGGAGCAAPLICARDDEVRAFLAERGAGDDLLWKVVGIAAQNRGRLRNDRAAREAVVEALLASSAAPGGTTMSGGGGVSGAGSPPAADLDAVQRPLLRGDRSAAVSAALSHQNYALALLIASMCDRATYQETARRFADEALPAGSPLRLAALRFSNNVDAPTDEALLDPMRGGSVWCGDEYGALAATWREQLASILSNPTPGWERIVLTLGDRLLQLGHCQAAHVCYLVSFCHFGPPSAKATRLVLLGCDHTAALHRRLMTPASVRSFERTEAFEWARRRGNRTTHIPALQPFKLRYAELLADFGYERLARDYLLSVRSCLGLDGADPRAPPAAAPHGEDFVEALKRLDDRICGSIGAAPSSWEGGKGDAKGAAAALGSLVKSVWGTKPTTDDARPSGGAELATREEVPRATGGAAEEPASEPARNAARPVDLYTRHHAAEDEEPPPEGDEMNESFMTTKTSLEPPAAAEGAPKSPRLLSNPFGHDLGNAASPKEKTNEEPPSSAPPMFGLDLEPKRPAEEEPNEKIVPSTPSQPAKPEEKKKAPASEPVQTPRSGGWFSKLLGRDSESKAKVADVGEDMQAYYCTVYKRWIFPGDDPAEVAKPLAPPPILPAKAAEDGPATPAVAAAVPSNDPLAAMMAPPPSRALNSRKKGTPLAGRYADPLASMGGVSAASNKKRMMPPSPMNQAPPTFAVFQPKPVSSEEEK